MSRGGREGAAGARAPLLRPQRQALGVRREAMKGPSQRCSGSLMISRSAKSRCRKPPTCSRSTTSSWTSRSDKSSSIPDCSPRRSASFSDCRTSSISLPRLVHCVIVARCSPPRLFD